MRLTLLPLLTVLTLAGCASAPPPVAHPPQPESDALVCAEAAECTTKVARSLLFVFDYAESGGALVRREGRRLFTPPDAPASAWPALQIRLPAPSHSRFEFASQCRLAHCRFGEAELAAIFRRYLDGDACLLSAQGC